MMDEKFVDIILGLIESFETSEKIILENGNGIRITVLPENYGIGCTD